MKWAAGEAGGVGRLVVQFLLTIIIAAVMYSGGETAARGVRKFGARLAGQRGEDAVVLASNAIRGVALGVVVTALVQSLLGGLGLAVAGVPLAGMLTAVMLLLCLAQLGPILVLLPATIWMYWSGDNLWGTLLLVWTLFVGTLDNFLRPFLIKQGADLPLLLIFAGVIGGLALARPPRHLRRTRGARRRLHTAGRMGQRGAAGRLTKKAGGHPPALCDARQRRRQAASADTSGVAAVASAAGASTSPGCRNPASGPSSFCFLRAL